MSFLRYRNGDGHSTIHCLLFLVELMLQLLSVHPATLFERLLVFFAFSDVSVQGRLVVPSCTFYLNRALPGFCWYGSEALFLPRYSHKLYEASPWLLLVGIFSDQGKNFSNDGAWSVHFSSYIKEQKLVSRQNENISRFNVYQKVYFMYVLSL